MITEFEKYNESIKDFQYMIEPEDMKYIKEPVIKVFIPEMFNRLIHRPAPFTFKEQKYILLYTGGTMLRKKDTSFDYSPKQWIAFRVEKHFVTIKEGGGNIYILKVYSGEKEAQFWSDNLLSIMTEMDEFTKLTKKTLMDWMPW